MIKARAKRRSRSLVAPCIVVVAALMALILYRFIADEGLETAKPLSSDAAPQTSDVPPATYPSTPKGDALNAAAVSSQEKMPLAAPAVQVK